jgi:NAD(P)H-flavin reductase
MKNGASLPATADVRADAAYQTRVTVLHDVGGGIRLISLAAPEGFSYYAGQYVYLSFGSFAPRPYSIASAPGGESLDIHIRDTGANGASTYAVRHLRIEEIVGLSGPAGDSFYDPALHRDRPLFCLAGGLGIAPVRAIVEAALSDPARIRPVSVCWGVRHAGDFYIREWFERVAQESRLLDFRPVVEDPLDPADLVQDVHLTEAEIFLAGPPALIAASLPVLAAHGADPAHVHFDSYEGAA